MGMVFLVVSAELTVLGIVFRIVFHKRGSQSSMLFWASVTMFIIAEAAAIAALCVLGHCTVSCTDEPTKAIFGSGMLALFNWFAAFFSCLDEP